MKRTSQSITANTGELTLPTVADCWRKQGMLPVLPFLLVACAVVFIAGGNRMGSGSMKSVRFAWLQRYNWLRPHRSLQRKPPISRLYLRDNVLTTHI